MAEQTHTRGKFNIHVVLLLPADRSTAHPATFNPFVSVTVLPGTNGSYSRTTLLFALFDLGM